MEPERGRIGDDGEDACLVQGAQVFLREAAYRVRENAQACGRGSCSVAKDAEMVVERELLIKENT